MSWQSAPSDAMRQVVMNHVSGVFILNCGAMPLFFRERPKPAIYIRVTVQRFFQQCRDELHSPMIVHHDQQFEQRQLLPNINREAQCQPGVTGW